MQIYGPSQIHTAQPISAPHNLRIVEAQTTSTAAAQPSDQLDISEAGQIAARLSDMPDIRQDRVDAIRAALLDGTYETSDKLDTAVSRLLDEIG